MAAVTAITPEQSVPPVHRGPVTSASYSITVRLTADGDPASVGRIATAVGSAGGVVTAIDVVGVPARPDHRRRHLLGGRRRALRRGRRRAGRGRRASTCTRSATAPSCCTWAARWRSHSKVPLRTRDDLSMAYTPGVGPGLHGAGRAPRGRPPADHQGQHGRRRHRRLGRARARRHRPGRGAAGDGGQGGAVQAVRRHRRLADLPGHPGRRRDRAHRRADRPRLRRHQPRGHRRARAASRSRPGCGSCSTSRSSTTTSTARRSSCSPRCATRCAASGSELEDVQVVVAGGGAAGTAIVDLLLAAGASDVLVWDREGVLSPDDDRLTPAKLRAGPADQPRRPTRRRCPTRWTAPTCSSG